MTRDTSITTAIARRQWLQTVCGATLLGALPALAAKSRAPEGDASASALWPHDSRVPGGVARLSLGPAPERPKVMTGDSQVLVLGDMIEWTAIVGIPLSAKVGEQHISVQTAKGSRALDYQVRGKKYTEQRLKVSPKTVDLSP